ncbi:MAG: hypothetical protein ACYC59_10125 [Anaerolineaceae bacterium]
MMRKIIKKVLLLVIGMCLLALPACITVEMNGTESASNPTAVVLNGDGQVQSANATQEPTADGRVLPTDPEYIEGEVEDTDSSKFASEKRVVSGDSYRSNFFERPFTSETMEYLPAIDIQYGYISSDDNFFIYTIVLASVDYTTNTLVGSYGVEMDIDADGRGEYSIWVKDPVSTTWTSENVRIFKDTNGDVGGKDKYTSDAPSSGDGYDQELPNTNAEAAFARVVPDYPTIVQIAVHRALVENPTEFLWGVWADNGLQNPGQFDYDDHYTYKDAGSPISGNQYYPLAAVHSCDNTCRRSYGFYPGYRIPNMCWSGGPVLTPTPGLTIIKFPGFEPRYKSPIVK